MFRTWTVVAIAIITIVLLGLGLLIISSDSDFREIQPHLPPLLFWAGIAVMIIFVIWVFRRNFPDTPEAQAESTRLKLATRHATVAFIIALSAFFDFVFAAFIAVLLFSY